jgi:hypothetical protein
VEKGKPASGLAESGLGPIDFIGKSGSHPTYPQITWVFADFSFENSPICAICKICGLFPIMSNK